MNEHQDTRPSPLSPKASRMIARDAPDHPEQVDLFGIAHTAIAQYGLDPHSRIELLDISENATFKVIDPTSDEAIVLRVHRPGYHTQAEVLSELDWLEALSAQAGVRTARVVCTSHGERIALIHAGEPETRMCVAFEFLNGAPPAEAQLSDSFRALGSITARMHRHALGWRRPAGFARFAWDLDAAYGQAPRWGDWRHGIGVGRAEVAVLERLQDTLTRRLIAYGTGAERYGLIHADLRLANLLADGDQLAVIDFDDCGWGWYVYDLAAGLSFIEHEPVVPELIDSWLEGYRIERDFSREDEREIRTFILFRRLLLTAWIGSHSTVEFARNLGAGYTVGTCALAEQYLSTYS